jgi:hypothetical protein
LVAPDGKVVKSWQGKPKVSVRKWVEEIQAVCEANTEKLHGKDFKVIKSNGEPLYKYGRE